MHHPTAANPTVHLLLFPLNTVLFPDGHLPLRIFEPRYLDMIDHCEAEGTPFGVVCLTEGDEVRRRVEGDGPGAAGFVPESFQSTGTLATITQIERPRPGLLAVRCRGGQRFRLTRREQQPHGLWRGEAELIEPDQAVAIPDDLAWLSTRLQQWSAQIAERLADTPADSPIQPPHRFNDCGWVANRFAELLPLDTAVRQNLMALQNPLLRLELVSDAVEQMDSAEASGGD